MSRNESSPRAWRQFKDLSYSLGRPVYQWAIRAAKMRAVSLDEHLAITEKVRFRGYTIRSYQKRSEILGLLTRIRDEHARVVVEIGTARGGTFYLLCRAASPDATVVSIDLPGGRFGSGYAEWKSPLFRSFAGPGQKVVLLRGDSRQMVEPLAKVIDAPIDFLLIDGDHSYEGVKGDFERYAPLVRPGGLIALHDIVAGDEAKVGGVPRFWRELKALYPHEEFVESWNQGGYGIGIVRRTNSDVPGTE